MDTQFVIPAVALAISVISAAIAIYSFIQNNSNKTRLQAFLQGKDGQDLEHVLVGHGESIKKIEGNLDDLLKASEYLHRAIQNSLRKVAFERYNPFPGVGGNQSFTLVLLDAFNSGVVISSMHNREATRVYAKGIRNGQPLQTLSGEEERVLKNAVLMKGA